MKTQSRSFFSSTILPSTSGDFGWGGFVHVAMVHGHLLFRAATMTTKLNPLGADFHLPTPMDTLISKILGQRLLADFANFVKKRKPLGVQLKPAKIG